MAPTAGAIGRRVARIGRPKRSEGASLEVHDRQLLHGETVASEIAELKGKCVRLGVRLSQEYLSGRIVT